MKINFHLFIFISLLLTGVSFSCNSVDIPEGVGPPIAHDDWTAILQLYVDSEGWVDYAGIQKNIKPLDDYLAKLSNHPPNDSWPENDQLAYWINAYNAFTVKLITDYYPIQSIKDIKRGIVFVNTVWDKKFFKIGGQRMDLNNIEHGIIRKIFDEPRIHFAVNCASVSCPKLFNEAFEGNRLEEQLTRATQSFLANTKKNTIGPDKLIISPIFRWFSGDFTKQGSLIEFIDQYVPSEIASDASIDYTDYDWGLNGQAEKQP